LTIVADWHDKTTEAALDPDRPVCDPHHHLWDHPRQRYLVAELLDDIGGGHRVDSTVYVECHRNYRSDGPSALRPVGETEYVHQLTASMQATPGRTRVAAGIVGFADLARGPHVQPVLEAHLKASDRFRGVRHATALDHDKRIHPAHTSPCAGLMVDPAFRSGVACLPEYGLIFDAWLYHHQIPELTQLAQACPRVTIVLNHAGGPLGIGPYAGRRAEVYECWRRHMADLSICDNVFVKLGGLSMKLNGFDWHRQPAPPSSTELADALRPYVEWCIERFGPARCMFESNFPIDRVSSSYTVLWNAFKRLVAGASAQDQAQLLHDTAVRLYRLGN